jgi:hypothetical protein
VWQGIWREMFELRVVVCVVVVEMQCKRHSLSNDTVIKGCVG